MTQQLLLRKQLSTENFRTLFRFFAAGQDRTFHRIFGFIIFRYSISAGLDYPGIGPMHANLAKQKRAIVLAVNDDEAIRAAYELTRLEGIIPALESAHALGALEKMRFKPTDVVVLTVSGRGDKDIETYLSDEL